MTDTVRVTGRCRPADRAGVAARARAGPDASSSATSSSTDARGSSSCRGSSSPSSTCCRSGWGCPSSSTPSTWTTRSWPYTVFVAPGLLASSAMNGATLDSTFNVFFKLKIAKTYDAVLSTPLGPGDVALGELTWALMRATIYSAAFLVVMAGLGYVASPWAVLCLPGGHDHQLRLRRGGDGGDDLHAQLAGLRQGLARPHPAVPVLRHLLSRCRCTRGGSRSWCAAPRCTRGWRCCRGLDLGIAVVVAGRPRRLPAGGGGLGLVVATRRMATLLLP